MDALTPDRPTMTGASEESHFVDSYGRKSYYGDSEMNRPRGRRQSCFQNDAVQSDQDLIASILRGDRRAAETFVIRYGRLIKAILRRMELSIEDRQDLYQQVFQHLWEGNCRRLSQWQARGNGKFSSFLETIVVRLVYDQNRRGDWLRRVEFLDPADEQCELAINSFNGVPASDLTLTVMFRQQKAAIDNLLWRLSARDAQIIWRRHYRDQNYREIADALQIRLDQVGIVLMRAERRLLKTLQSSYPGLCD